MNDEERYAALSKTYATNMKQVWKEAIQRGWAASPLYGYTPPPLTVLDGRVRLSCFAIVIRQGRQPAQGVTLKCYGYVAGEPPRLMRQEHLKPDTSVKEQRRVMTAMCDIVALQEGHEYTIDVRLRPIAPRIPAKGPRGRWE